MKFDEALKLIEPLEVPSKDYDCGTTTITKEGIITEFTMTLTRQFSKNNGDS